MLRKAIWTVNINNGEKTTMKGYFHKFLNRSYANGIIEIYAICEMGNGEIVFVDPIAEELMLFEVVSK